jgi:DNA-binding transcriptional LysR family regulator
VDAALETNSVLALVTALGAGRVAAVLPGALVRSVQGVAGLRACPLVAPVVRTPIGFMTSKSARATPALRAALAIAQDPAWLAEAAAHSGSLSADLLTPTLAD